MSKLEFTLALLCPKCGQRGAAEWAADEGADDPAQVALVTLSNGFRSETAPELPKIFCETCQTQVPD